MKKRDGETRIKSELAILFFCGQLFSIFLECMRRVPSEIAGNSGEAKKLSSVKEGII